MVMSVCGDLITLERRDFGTDLPLGPDLVFSTDLKLRPKYRDASRKVASIAPEFAVDAKVTAVTRMGKDRQGHPTDQVVVTFPTVKATGNRPRAYEYFVRVEKTDGTLLKEKRVYSPGINLPESLDEPVSSCVFSKEEIAADGPVRFVVRPANCWGVAGRSVVCHI